MRTFSGGLTAAAVHRTSTFFLFLASKLRSRDDNKSGSDWTPPEDKNGVTSCLS